MGKKGDDQILLSLKKQLLDSLLTNIILCSSLESRKSLLPGACDMVLVSNKISSKYGTYP